MQQKMASHARMTCADVILWSLSVSMIVIAFCVFDKHNFLVLAASLVGVTSLILAAKGNPISQVLILVFSILYAIISYTSSYFGEMITYLGMTAPMAVFALVSWLRHPYRGKKNEVEVGRIPLWEIPVMLGLTAGVTAVFYPLLAYFHTANLIPSTLSVATSFLAVYLTFRRSPFFAIAYATNDIVLIVLWGMVAVKDISALSMVICFVAFLANDIYGFVSWCRMERRQKSSDNQTNE